MKIRLARSEDAPEMASILNEIIRIGGTTAYQSPVSPGYFSKFIDGADPTTFLHLACNGDIHGDILGFQWITPDEGFGDPAQGFAPPEPGMGSIATFAKPGLTGRGIGAVLFEATKKAARAAGYHTLEATIRADNPGGLKYYSKMGFLDHSVFKAIPLEDGTKVDRIHKRLALQAVRQTS